jgi:hypothetical protein
MWADVYRELRERGRGAELVIDKALLAPPASEGARASMGLGPGAHWRFAPDDDGRGMHVRETADTYEAHLDRVHPECSVLAHLRADAPAVLILSGTSAGAALGAIAGGSGRGALIGGALGFAATLLVSTRVR